MFLLIRFFFVVTCLLLQVTWKYWHISLDQLVHCCLSMFCCFYLPYVNWPVADGNRTMWNLQVISIGECIIFFFKYGKREAVMILVQKFLSRILCNCFSLRWIYDILFVEFSIAWGQKHWLHSNPSKKNLKMKFWNWSNDLEKLGNST
jgi:hypothetical protein